MVGVFPCLDAHNCIRHDIDKCLCHGSHHQEHRDKEAVCFVEEVNRDQRTELNDAHQYNIRLSVCAGDRYIVTEEPVDNFYAPGNVDYAHVDCHLPWIQLQIRLE